MSSPTKIFDEYDIVLAGGGAAACIIAGRLATADANLRILILEAGPTTFNDLSHRQPARFIHHISPGSRTVRVHASTPTAALGGRSVFVPTGQCLGGGGSVNFAMYTRASASDYDDWERVYRNPGWGSQDLIPLLRKTETYQLAHGGPTHGRDGPLRVSYGGKFIDIGQQFLEVARTLDPSRASAPDADSNNLDTINVYTRWPKWIDAETGYRSDVPHQLIYPLAETRPNLHFVTGVHVKHITFDDDNRATGVAFTLNPLFHPDGPTETRTVRASKLVVVSAGSFGSPGILERSGIGAASVLGRVGVKQRVDLPGVGENYQDHGIVLTPYFAADEAETLDHILRNDEGAIEAATAEFEKTKQGLIAHNSIDFGIKWRPSESELADLGPEFRKRWDAWYANAPDKPVLWIGSAGMLIGDPTLVPARKYFTVGAYNEYPVARGHVHIKDASDVAAPLDFVPNYLESLADVHLLAWSYKFMREIARRMPHFRGEPPVLHPKFPAGSAAAVIPHAEGAVAFDTPRIVYSEEDDRAIEEYVRAIFGTNWHALGTCAMKAREEGGVVDSHLNVYGVRGLKVADLSIAPGNVSANTYSTALVIGEKAATIIAAELGIVGV
ncbi:alcohol oxidase-like protein [Gloeopeniophorella convolvens]|nr:alcohol oxidase-like protein [Gloeopeniophorella convolvens]